MRALKDLEIIVRRTKRIIWKGDGSRGHSLHDPGCDHGPGRFVAGGCEGGVSGRLGDRREIQFQLIKAVTELPEHELLSYLSALMYAELVYERGIFPESTYVFKHAITREVVYDSILTNRKKLLHQKIGNAIEELYQEVSMLSQHFGRSFYGREDFQKSADYSRLTYEQAEDKPPFHRRFRRGKKDRCPGTLPLTPEVQLISLMPGPVWFDSIKGC